MAQGAAAGYSFDFTQKVVLVTGAGSGIGRQIALDFAAAGAEVVLAGRTRSRLDDVAAEIGARAHVAPVDIGDGGDVDALIGAVLRDHGHVDVVVSNAADFVPGDITEISDEVWERLRRTNIDGFFHLAKAALPALAGSGGNFVATSSVSGLRGDWGSAIYNASKGAVSLFVQSLALDWGSRGVRINAVAPALTNTGPVAGITGTPAFRQQFEHRTALGRIGEVEDISPAVLFLASDAARYITGAILPVDGGTTASSGQAHLVAG